MNAFRRGRFLIGFSKNLVLPHLQPQRTEDAVKPLLFRTALRSVGHEAPHEPELTMSLPRSVAEILCDHVTLEVEGIDRMHTGSLEALRVTRPEAVVFSR